MIFLQYPNSEESDSAWTKEQSQMSKLMILNEQEETKTNDVNHFQEKNQTSRAKKLC